MEKKTSDKRQTKAQLMQRIQQLEEMNSSLRQTVEQKVIESRKQEQLSMRRIKLSAMGQMASAIAHQWRQPLTSITFILQNISNNFQDGKLDEHRLDKAIEDAGRLIERMSNVIDDLREFIKPAKAKTVFDLVEAVQETLLLLNAQMKSYEINHQFLHQSIPHLYFPGFPEEFKQVLINILNNAMSSITRRIESGDLPPGKGLIRIDIFRKEDQVNITIHNNGFAISSESMSRIFEPFYASSQTLKGKGVGLYMAKVIIEDKMQGQIFVRNDENNVIFTIKIPINKKV